MTANYTIFQLNDSEVSRGIKFMGYDFVKECEVNLTLDLYNEVYSGKVEGRSEFFDNTKELCDNIYMKFNLNHPADFKGHSLSTSDIVKIENHYYYCDDYGWVEVKF